VVEPEIGHHLLELTLAVDGPNNFLGFEFLEKFLRKIEAVFFVVREHLPALIAFIFVALTHSELPGEFLDGRILLQELRDSHAEGRNRGKPRLGYRVMDSFRVKLLIEILGDPGFLNSLNVAWAGAEADPIE